MKKLDPLIRGIVVFLLLGVLTAIEYFLGVNEVPQILLWLIAIIKVVLVLHYFMHFLRLFRKDEGEH
jgi:hypothetical protein